MANINSALAEFFVTSAKPWDKRHKGAALSLPAEFKTLALRGKLYIEYLQTFKPEADRGDLPNKNHVVFQLPFVGGGIELTNPVTDQSISVKGARISMDISDADEDLVDMDKDRIESPYTDWTLNQDYFPGSLNVKLLSYDGMSIASSKISKFDLVGFATLGDFVDFLIGKKIHQMSFLGYGVAWKGCHDFITQTYIQLLLVGKITETDQDGKTLVDNITKVYHENGEYHHKLVDRGHFLDYEHVITDQFVDAYQPVEA